MHSLKGFGQQASQKTNNQAWPLVKRVACGLGLLAAGLLLGACTSLQTAPPAEPGVLPALRRDVKWTATYYDASMHDPERLALDVLMDGEIAITRNDMPETPFVYRGFRMVDENKLRALPAAKLEDLSKNGMLMLIYAHLFSLNLMRNIFERQLAQGKVPMTQQGAPALN